MRILVTGAAGFVGSHALAELRAAGHEPLCFDRRSAPGIAPDRMFTGDVCDAGAVADLVARIQPEACLHLAGIAYVPAGWRDPAAMFSVNVLGTINVLQALKERSPGTRILVVTSCEIYGPPRGAQPLAEDAPMAPENPYACSKMAADQMTLLFARRFGLQAMTARPDNHAGPGQDPLFVTAAFAAQLAAMADGKTPPVLRVGNLDNERDFTDVRDVVRAYRLLLERGRGGEAYNISSERQVSIRKVLDHLCAVAGVTPRIEVDRERHRPTEARPMLDTSRIRREVGWRPEIPLETTLRDTYLHARRDRP